MISGDFNADEEGAKQAGTRATKTFACNVSYLCTRKYDRTM
jgi:hypothetical protein